MKDAQSILFRSLLLPVVALLLLLETHFELLVDPPVLVLLLERCSGCQHLVRARDVRGRPFWTEVVLLEGRAVGSGETIRVPAVVVVPCLAVFAGVFLLPLRYRGVVLPEVPLVVLSLLVQKGILVDWVGLGGLGRWRDVGGLGVILLVPVEKNSLVPGLDGKKEKKSVVVLYSFLKLP